MDIKICENKQDWENYTKTLEKAEFLQSWDWGEFQKNTGKEVLRLQIVENGAVSGQMQGFVHELGLGVKYLYAPRVHSSQFMVHSVIDYLKKNKFAFIRIEGVDKFRTKNYELRTVRNRQPVTTLLLDLTQSEEVLLQQMHSKTRYNIGLAEKKGVEVKSGKDIEAFWKLNEQTTGRDKFKSHDKNYYAKMLDNNFCHQLTAYHDYQPIASNLFIVYGDTCTYLHGASSNEYRNLMAPYLLQWEGIKMAKKLGCKYYDFWGIAPIVEEGKGEQVSCFNNFCWEVNHPWTGVTRFKVGFGGNVREYPQAVDVVLSRWKYVVYRLARRLLSSRA
ncbi:MAG: peptidoglycan bridge formation glycyltransferase FemA/FemB family protein [Candidatus Magasanikbacteria bacterium]